MERTAFSPAIAGGFAVPKRDELLALERGFWTGDDEFFRENSDSGVLVAFPHMAGVLGRKDLAETAKNPNRWQSLEMEIKGILEPQDGLVVLTYEAKAVRENGEPYNALISTGYLKRGDGWKMIFHTQAPLDPGTN
jgi:hypothetical protein